MITERIRILIESILDSRGFRQSQKCIAQLKKVGTLTQKPFIALKNTLVNISKKLEYTGDELKRFPAYLLSIMFFGMQLQRTFLGFLKSAITTYMKVTEGQTRLGKAMLKAQAAWEFFKFSIIKALSPLIIYFAELAANLADFISAHPFLLKIIAGFVLLGAVLGTAMVWFGQLGLGIWGITKLLSVLPGLFGTIGGAFSTLMANPILIAIAGLVAAGAFLYLAWTNNWFGIRDTLTAVWNGLVGIFTGLVDWLTKGITGALLFFQGIWNTIWGALEPYVSPILQDLMEIWNATMKFLITVLREWWEIQKMIFQLFIVIVLKIGEKLERYLGPVFQSVFGAMKATAEAFGNAIKWVWEHLIKPPLEAMVSMMHRVKEVYDATIGAIAGAVTGAAEWVKGGIAGATEWVKSLQGGGIIVKPTLAMLHPGETVIPASKSPPVSIVISPTYNVSGTDVEELRRVLEEHDRYLMDEISRIKIPGV